MDMNIDDRIKKELENEVEDMKQTLEAPQGMFALVASAYQGGLGRWVILVTISTLIASFFLIWSAYEFFTAIPQNDKLHWGICFVIALVIQISLKQWTWMEMNRNSLIREIKRLEVSIERLSS